MLIALGPPLVAAAGLLHAPRYGAGGGLPEELPWWLRVALLLALALGVAGTLPRRARPLQRILIGLGALGFLGLAAPTLGERPGLALALLLVVAALLRLLLAPPPGEEPQPTRSLARVRLAHRGSAAATAAWVALATWFFFAVLQPDPGPLGYLAVLATSAIALRFALGWLARSPRPLPALLGGLVLYGGAALACWAPHSDPLLPLHTLALVPTATLTLLRLGRHRGDDRGSEAGPWDALFEQPARLLVGTFLGLCAAGALLLSLPLASSSGQGLAGIDATFTAVSATCVTGLAVVDTGSAFSPLGQLGVLLLIQLGGLGIMTFYAAAAALLGRRLGLRQEGAVADMLNSDDRRNLARSLRQLLGLTGVTELLGAIALTVLFWQGGDSLSQASWRGVFTSISAFCNAGFALQSDSLVAYQHQPLVLHVVALLITVGGLGPAVVLGLPRLLQRRPVPLHTRLVVGFSLALTLGGAALLAALEWDASLADLSLLDRLHNAYFQSVTLRTAGFNSVDFGLLRSGSSLLMIFFMFVGGSPGSTAGGVKTTTVLLVLLAARAALRGEAEVQVLRRRVPQSTIYKSVAIITLGLLCVAVAALALEITQGIEPRAAAFEVVSALGTVGLTLGATAQLDGVGKVIVMLCMFLGRVGPLTLFVLLVDRSSGSASRPPEEDVVVG